jgi:hypothetical protein
MLRHVSRFQHAQYVCFERVRFVLGITRMELGHAKLVTAFLGFHHGRVPRGDHRDGGEDLVDLARVRPFAQLRATEQAEVPLASHLLAGGFRGQDDAAGFLHVLLLDLGAGLAIVEREQDSRDCAELDQPDQRQFLGKIHAS